MTARTSTRRGNERLGRHFGRLWVGFTLASSGDGFAYGAVPLLAVVIDPHPLAISAVVAADELPWLLMALPAGAFADRFRRARLMAVVNLLRGGVLLVAGLLVLSHRMDLALLILAVLMNAGGRAVYYSSLQATVPELVAPRSLERANGALTGTEAAAEHVAGPVVGAAAFAAARALPFLADAAALAFSGLPLVRLRTKTPPPTGPSGSVWGGSIWDGARHLFADRRLRLLVVTMCSLAGLQGLVNGVLVLIATKDWGVHAEAYGAFLAAGAVGTIPGAVVAERLVARFGSGFTLLGAAAACATGYFVMAWSRTWLLAGPAFALTGFAVGAGTVVAISMRQRLTPDELMGRVGAAWRGIIWGAAPVGALAAGGLAVLGGLRLPLYLAGALQFAVVVILARPLVRGLPKSADASP